MLQVQGNLEVGALLKAYARLSSRAVALTLTDTKIVTRADPQLLYVTNPGPTQQIIQLPSANGSQLTGLTQLIDCSASTTAQIVVQDSNTTHLADLFAGDIYRFIMMGAVSSTGSLVPTVPTHGTINFGAVLAGIAGNAYTVIVEDDPLIVNPGDETVTLVGTTYTIKVNATFTAIQTIVEKFNALADPSVLSSVAYGESNLLIPLGTVQLHGGMEGFWQVQNLRANSGTPPFSQTFEIANWFDGVTELTFTITSATHGSLQPRPQVYSLVGGVYTPIIVDVRLSNTNDVTLSIAPGTAFDGKVVIL